MGRTYEEIMAAGGKHPDEAVAPRQGRTLEEVLAAGGKVADDAPPAIPTVKQAAMKLGGQMVDSGAKALKSIGDAPMPQTPDVGPGQGRAAVLGFAQGATKGYADEMGGMFGKYMLDEPVKLTPQAEKEAAGLGIKTEKPLSNYDLVRDGMRNELHQAEEKYPKTVAGFGMAGDVAGDTAVGLLGGAPLSLGYQVASGAAGGVGRSDESGVNLVGDALTGATAGYVGGKYIAPVLAKGTKAVAGSARRAINKLLAPGSEAAQSAGREAATEFSTLGQKAEDKATKHILGENQSEATRAVVENARAPELQAKYESETAMHLSQKEVARQQAENIARKSIEKEQAALTKEYEAAMQEHARATTSVEKAKATRAMDELRAQALAIREARSENVTAAKGWENYQAKQKSRALRDILFHSSENSAEPAKIQRQIEDALAKVHGVEASKAGLVGEKTQSAYQAASLYGDALKAKPDADPAALARLAELEAGMGGAGERRMLDPKPEQIAEATHAERLRLAMERLEATKSLVGKSPAPADVAKQLAHVPDVAPADVDLVANARIKGDQAAKVAPPKVGRLSRDEVRDAGRKRLTPEWLEAHRPDLLEKLTKPLPTTPTAPVAPNLLTPDETQAETLRRSTLQKWLQEKNPTLAAKLRSPPPNAPGIYPGGRRPVPDPLTEVEARELSMERLAEPDYVARELKDPALAHKLRNPPPAYGIPVPPEEALVEGLPKWRNPVTAPVKHQLGKMAREFGLNTPANAPFMQTQGGYKVLKQIEDTANNTKMRSVAGTSLEELIRQLNEAGRE